MEWTPVGVALGTLGLQAPGLDDLRRGAGGRQAAVELQVMFLTQLIQAMRRTVPESDLLPPSPARQVYEGLFDREVARALAAGDPLGLVGSLGGDQDGLKPGGDPADTVTGHQNPGRDDAAS